MPIRPEVQALLSEKPAPSIRPEVQDLINPVSNPEKMAAWGLRGVQMAGGALPFGISSVTTTPATEYAIGRLEHKTPEEIAKNVKLASGTDLAVSAATAGLPFIGAALKPELKIGVKALAKEAAKPTVSHGIAQIIGGLGERDVKRLVRDRIPIGSGANLDKLYGTAANKIERLVEGKKDLVNDLYGRAMAEKGIPQTALVSAKNVKTTISDILKEFTDKDIAGLGKETSMALSNVKKSLGNKKNLSLDQIKNIKNALHEISQKAYDEGVGNKFTALAKKAEGAAIEAENTIPGMKELNKEYRTTIKAINKLQNITKTRLAEGEIINSRMPLAGRLMRLKKEDVYSPQLRQLQAIDKVIGKKLGNEYRFMDNLDTALITDKLTKSGKLGLETTGYGSTPRGILKQLSNITLTSPIMKARAARALGKNLPQGILSKEVSGVFPRLSTIKTLAPKRTGTALMKTAAEAYERNKE